ncbi:conserved hypothetical protein [Paecilomyces variotii No. 5]|uniref:Uncharacterized protein n=1 Tax=Byssochlamys spectabilis (strain No. 5 / NBRC 109023) TaxID=1356009 RepID=V5F8H4_BYSSN|nr:conserved hypothetical protein [Paecilomyces variotii No. 5]
MSEELLDFNAERVDRQMADLLDSFESHPRMQPPNVNPTIFFLFDFVRNTHRQLKTIDVDKLRAGDKAARQQVTEVLARNRFANELISDKSGKLAMMTGDDPRNPVDLGPDIRAKAQALLQV